jgi:hypothetical protein
MALTKARPNDSSQPNFGARDEEFSSADPDVSDYVSSDFNILSDRDGDLSADLDVSDDVVESEGGSDEASESEPKAKRAKLSSKYFPLRHLDGNANYYRTTQ